MHVNPHEEPLPASGRGRAARLSTTPVPAALPGPPYRRAPEILGLAPASTDPASPLHASRAGVTSSYGRCFASSSPSGLSLRAKGDGSLERPRLPVPGLADCRPRGRQHHRPCDARHASASRDAPAIHNRGIGVCVKGNAGHAFTLVLGSKLRPKSMRHKTAQHRVHN